MDQSLKPLEALIRGPFYIQLCFKKLFENLWFFSNQLINHHMEWVYIISNIKCRINLPPPPPSSRPLPILKFCYYYYFSFPYFLWIIYAIFLFIYIIINRLLFLLCVKLHLKKNKKVFFFFNFFYQWLLKVWNMQDNKCWKKKND